MNCRICNVIIKDNILAKDVDTKNEFIYSLCNNCGVAFLNELPENYANYYFNSYYSLTAKQGKNILARIKHLRDKNDFVGFNLVGYLFGCITPNYTLKAIERLGLSKDSKLLDVGCGIGKEIVFLRDFGYTNVIGVDPFIEADIYYNGNKIVEKKDIFDTIGLYDFITMHHSFEHVLNPKEVLEKIKCILNESGTLMIRIPLKDSFAFEKYGTSWVQFDAPRHTFLHTKKSMAILCEEVGLEITEIIYDSTAFQFWASEICKDGVSIHKASLSTIYRYKLKSFLMNTLSKVKKMNTTQKGDQAIFLVKKKR